MTRLKSTLLLCAFLCFANSIVSAQPTFNLSFSSRAKLKVGKTGGSPEVDKTTQVSGNYMAICFKKDDQLMMQFLQKNGAGEWQTLSEWDVDGRPFQYYPDNPNSYAYNLINVGAEMARVIWVKGRYLALVNSRGGGYVFYESVTLTASSVLKEAFDVIGSDGITIYHYNHSAEVGAWTSNLKSGDDQRLMFLAPEEDASYRITDTNETRVYRFLKNQPYSSILLREKLGDEVHFSGDTIILTRDYLHDRNNDIPRQFRYMWYYPDNIEMLSWESQCPACGDTGRVSWETGKGMLLFTSNEVARVKLTVKYRLIKPKDSLSVRDTLRLSKVIHDTVYINRGEVSGAETPSKIAVVEKEKFSLKHKTLNIAVWDNAGVDGDIITLTLNGKVIIDHLKLDKCHTNLEVTLDPGDNLLVMHAENLGTSPPNTASFLFTAPGFKKVVVLRADMGYSESVKIVNE